VPLNEDLLSQVRLLLGQVLGLGPRAEDLNADTALLGSLPELDSMAVATILTAIEDRFGLTIDDSQISADIFETLGNLSQFVDQQRRTTDQAA
jgi:acyl carrier protein